MWTARGNLPDFRPMARADLGLFPALDTIAEGAEYKYGTFGDEGASIILATYGKMFAITRQAIINDQLDVFTLSPEKMGRAAKRTIGNLVYSILNGNPLMQDGLALFHANHGNLVASGSGGAPSVATGSCPLRMRPIAIGPKLIVRSEIPHRPVTQMKPKRP